MSATQSSGHRSTLMNLPLKLPGMEVGGGGGGGSTPNIAVAAGRHAMNFKTEVTALNTAATETLANLDKIHKKVVFFIDAL